MIQKERQNIVTLDGLQIDFFPAAASTGHVAITFTQFTNRLLDGYGFGGAFATQQGFDVVAVKTDRDEWFQSLSDDLCAGIDEFLSARLPATYFRATYGSSMGAYAAILFAKPLRAQAVLAISPQFDIAAPWDSRWAAYAKSGNLRPLTTALVSPDCRYTIIYDPMDRDQLHVDKFAEIIPPAQLHTIKVRFGGHPAGANLASAGALKETANKALRGEPVPNVTQQLRANRRRDARYLFELSRHCVKRRKLTWAESAASQAVGIAPSNVDYQIHLAVVLERQRKLWEAMTQAAVALALAPSHPSVIATLSRILQKQKFYKQALHYMDAAIAVRGINPGLQAQRDALIKEMG
jgi:tetratricopeptide (TPR) repeat protein